MCKISSRIGWRSRSRSIHFPDNTVTVYWQNVSGWTLHQNGNLANSTGWSVDSSWTTTSGTNYLNLTTPTGNLFFRLSNP
jgi:hypothetical protein